MRKILLSHGEGGLATERLIESVFASKLSNAYLAKMEDSAIFELDGKKYAFTTDAFIVEPVFFPGGDIGKLAVSGVVNDLAAMGAKPLFFSADFIIEEGFSIDKLDIIVKSFANELKEIGALLVAADTKVVPLGQGGDIYIAVSAIGEVICEVGTHMIQSGDEIVLSGDIARHSAAIISVRENIETEPTILSDCAPLWDLVNTAFETDVEIHAMRDATRGGLATILVELSNKSDMGMEIYQEKIPINPQVSVICELYGFDPLYLACEGVMVFFAAKDNGEKLLSVLKKHNLGRNAEIIGRVSNDNGVILHTPIGGRRKLIKLEGEQLPRIC